MTTLTKTSVRNRIAAAALAGMAAAAIAAPTVTAAIDSTATSTVHAKANDGGGNCSPFICGSSGNHNEVLTRGTR
jgi:hypothetical protein